MTTTQLLTIALNFMRRRQEGDYLTSPYCQTMRGLIGKVVKMYQEDPYFDFVEKSERGFRFFLNWTLHEASIQEDEDVFFDTVKYLRTEGGKKWYIGNFKFYHHL